MKINRNKYFVGKDKATKHVLFLAKSLNITPPGFKDFSKDLILKTDAKNFRVNFSKEVQDVIKTGRSSMLQTWFDANDRFLQPALEMSIEESVPGIGITMSSSLAGYTATASSGSVLESPELALARDICYYHERTCELYNDGDMSGFSRSFRGFLHSSVALVDCFLFRYTFHLKEMIEDTSEYANTMTLDSKTRVEDRLEAWMQTFAASELGSFPNWKERSQFMELKAKRNEFTHPTVPSVALNPVEVVRYLNFGATGVGGMLAKMRKASATSDKIGFIYQIHHLPNVSLQKQPK